MSWYIVDNESDAQSPAVGSLVCFGVVKLTYQLDKTFYGKTKPVMDTFDPEALAISGFTREQHLTFDDPKLVFINFVKWIEETNKKGTRPTFVSDNVAFDWQWTNYYFHKFIGSNPFGFSARRIGDIYCGIKNDVTKNSEWKWKYRKTKHDHNPVNDAIGNAESLIGIAKDFKINIPIE